MPANGRCDLIQRLKG